MIVTWDFFLSWLSLQSSIRGLLQLLWIGDRNGLEGFDLLTHAVVGGLG